MPSSSAPMSPLKQAKRLRFSGASAPPFANPQKSYPAKKEHSPQLRGFSSSPTSKQKRSHQRRNYSLVNILTQTLLKRNPIIPQLHATKIAQSMLIRDRPTVFMGRCFVIVGDGGVVLFFSCDVHFFHGEGFDAFCWRGHGGMGGGGRGRGGRGGGNTREKKEYVRGDMLKRNACRENLRA